MTTLLIDNHDSFTYNLAHLIARAEGGWPLVVRNDEGTWSELERLRFDRIVISPGPGRPDRHEDFGLSRDAILCARTGVPVLGVCLGHQGIGHHFGARITQAPELFHGRTSSIHHEGSSLFQGIPSPFPATRYHSWILASELPPELEALAWTEDRVLMALRHRSLPLWGVQFHPESILTDQGLQLLRNFQQVPTARKPSSGLPLNRPMADAPTKSGAQEPRPLRATFRKVPLLPDPAHVFKELFGQSESAFWLDSSSARPGVPCFSFLGDLSGPGSRRLTYHGEGRKLKIHPAGPGSPGAPVEHEESVFSFLARELGDQAAQNPGLPFDFIGGWVGYFGYELKAECGAPGAHASRIPDANWLQPTRFLALDHETQCTYLVSLEERDSPEVHPWMNQMEGALRKLAAFPSPETAPSVFAGLTEELTAFQPRLTREIYLNAISECLARIRAGESYELCLTNCWSMPTEADPLEVYLTLRKMNPSPYSAFLRFPEVSILSSSPERFLKVDDQGRIETKPIKGTAPRDPDPECDRRIAEALRCDVKSRAENLMIVDLLRNDLGRVAEIGSVEVPHLMAVESYTTVHQLVSTVRARLRPDKSVLDLVQAAFPGGSMTGAPKLRSLEILDALEGGPREVYSGTLGFLSLSGAADLNIVIRTIQMNDGLASIGTGGAITALSNREAEWEETLLKARAPMRALLHSLRYADGALAYQSSCDKV